MSNLIALTLIFNITLSGLANSPRYNSVLSNGYPDFPPTVITSKYSTSPYATTKNAFYASDPGLKGQCTWYAYGRVIELSEAGYLDSSAATIMYNAFWGKSGRDAINWPSFLGGEWTATTSTPLPLDKRKPGMLAVWRGGEHGHVGFVEEVSADKTQYRLSDFNRSLDESYKNVWYKYEGTSDYLLGTYPSFYQLPLSAAPSPYEGYHDGVDCDKIYGWAWNKDQPDSAIYVDIYDNGSLLASHVLANGYRSDLPGNHYHAFNYPTPASLKNGQSHSIRVKFSDTNVDLSSTPKSFSSTCGATPPAPPTAVSPGTNSDPGEAVNTTTPTFRWNGSPGATRYSLYVSKYPYGASNIIYSNESLDGTSHTIPAGRLVSGEKYRWNMTASNSAGESGVSNTLYFNVNVVNVQNPTAQEISDYANQLSSSYKFPSVIFKALLEQESGWRQFNSDGSTVIHTEPDGRIGIGLTQITVQNTSTVTLSLGVIQEGTPQGSNSFTTTAQSTSVDVNRLKTDWRYNMEVGARVLVAKKFSSGGAGDDAGILENWYYPLAYYNGAVKGGANDPNNPSYSRSVSSNSDWKSISRFPYQECIYNIVAQLYPIPSSRSSFFGPPIKVTLPGPSAVAAGAGQYNYVESVFCFFDWAVYFSDGTVHMGNWGSNNNGCISQQKTRTGITVHKVPFGAPSSSVPDPPTAISPGTSSEPGTEVTTTTPNFQWSPSPGATRYSLYVSKYPYGASNIIYSNESLGGTSFPMPSGRLVSGEKYRWNMTASNSAGESGVSNTLYFNVNVNSTTSSVQFSSATYSASENGGSRTVTVTRTGGTNAFAVNYGTSNGTATAGADYTGVAGVLSFATNETSKTFSVPITNDTSAEGSETLNLTLSNPSGGVSLGSPSAAVLTIVDDDDNTGCTYSISSSENTVSPGIVSVRFLMDAPSGCAWTAVSDSPSWLTTSSSGSGDGNVNYQTAANPSTSPRVGHITVGGQVHTVTQIGIGGAGTVRFSSASYSANEAGGNVTITVTRTGGTGTGTVQYSTSDGTAKAGTDYVAASGTLLFVGDQTSKSFDVTLLNDAILEGNESFSLSLKNNSSSLTLGSPSTATFTIIDSSTGTAPGVTTKSATNVTGKGAVINGSVNPNGAATSGWFEWGTSPTLSTFMKTGSQPVGSGNTAVNISAGVGGLNPGTTYYFRAAASNASGTRRGNILSFKATAIAVPTLRVNSITVTEKNPGSNTPAIFTVSLSAPSSQYVSVKYQTVNGSAIASKDYVPLVLTTLTFLPGQTVRTVNAPAIGDALDEVNETYRLLLSSPTNATIAVGTGTCTILDNDPPPNITIDNATLTEPDSGVGYMTFTVRLSAPSGRPVSVKYQTANGTAAAGTDYTAVPLTTLIFQPGQTVRTFRVAIAGDIGKESNETFYVNLSGAVNAFITDAQATGVIMNDD